MNYISYDKEKAIKELHKKIDFEYYGGKHCESIFTRLYQGYILPTKFGINKSKAYYSSLIVANQITRASALNELSINNYIGSKQLEEDINSFIEKTNISRQKFDEIINNGFVRDHREFKNFEKTYKFFDKLKKIFKR